VEPGPPAIDIDTRADRFAGTLGKRVREFDGLTRLRAVVPEGNALEFFEEVVVRDGRLR